MTQKKMLVLPCKKVAKVSGYWQEFDFPFFGCHDFCPKGNGFMDSGNCKWFNQQYEKWSKLADLSYGQMEGCKWVVVNEQP